MNRPRFCCTPEENRLLALVASRNERSSDFEIIEEVRGGGD